MMEGKREIAMPVPEDMLATPEGRALLGRLLVSLRRRRPKTCAVCGSQFEGLNFQLYCSKRCQRRATVRRHYWRHRETVLAKQREYRLRRKAQQQGEV
jgi:endogenous inhibitor of DNA gyrase (YacG/DUF329 family)